MPPRAGCSALEPEPIDFVLDLPSDLRVVEGLITHLVERCNAYGFQGARLNLNFRVGVTEALANAILYGNRRRPERRVRVEVSLSTESVAVLISDEGRGFDPARVPDPTEAENLNRAGGRGLFLIRKLMDAVEFNDAGNAVRLVLNRESPARRPVGT